MSDSEFVSLLGRVIKANIKYKNLLKLAEDEYEKRFGHNPSDIGDDNWLDIFHYNVDVELDLEQIKEEAELCVVLYKDNHL